MLTSLKVSPTPCIEEQFLEVRDGHNESANLLGIFCGGYTTAVVRSSGRYMWLKLSPGSRYALVAYYSGKVMSRTGTYLLDMKLHYKRIDSCILLRTISVIT